MQATDRGGKLCKRCCEFFGEVAHVAICGADDGKQEYKQTCICGKSCTVLGLTDVAELGAWVQDEVFHVVEGFRVTRKPVAPSKWTEND